MSRILTGIQSSGRPHLGNILGAIKPAIDLAKDPANESFLFIADLHSLTTLKDGPTRREFTRAVAATWLAFGFDTVKNTFWRQSRVPEHTELAWLLNCFTPMPMLLNATSFKDKSEKAATVSAGLFTYPVLQAADILLYDAEIIPVGKDQRQHIEMTRDIASAVNHQYNADLFVLPEPRIDDRLMVIPGIDGQKMSKSYNNYIDIFLPANELYKVVKKIKSDSTPLDQPKNPDT
ncbi:MAG: tryptophan--tRNA ligase, partial [Bacteroidetes bacterium]|nr:tryptophan--tRNA ligase [Fibrella sp.]